VLIILLIASESYQRMQYRFTCFYAKADERLDAWSHLHRTWYMAAFSRSDPCAVRIPFLKGYMPFSTNVVRTRAASVVPTVEKGSLWLQDHQNPARRARS